MDVADQLATEVLRRDPAVAGTLPAWRTLQQRRVEVLVMAKQYEPEPEWGCRECGLLAFTRIAATVCQHCRAKAVRRLNIKEKMIRMAELGH